MHGHDGSPDLITNYLLQLFVTIFRERLLENRLQELLVLSSTCVIAKARVGGNVFEAEKFNELLHCSSSRKDPIPFGN